MNSYSAAGEFHAVVGQPVLPRPTIPPRDRLLLRLNLIIAEFSEVVGALVGRGPEDDGVKSLKKQLKGNLALALVDASPPDLVNLARQIADLHYVLSGTSLEFGLPEPAVIAEVHWANLEKVGGPLRADGKQLPPVGWQPPDIFRVLLAAGWRPPDDAYHPSHSLNHRESCVGCGAFRGSRASFLPCWNETAPA